GFENLTTLTAGALGSSATTNTAGAFGGVFTFFYDAVEGVLPARVITPPVPPVLPPTFPPFAFIDFVFQDQFDSFTRYTEFLENESTGNASGLYSSLSIVELDDDVEGVGGSRLENGLDGFFGKRKNSYSASEIEEERRRLRRNIAGGVGPGGGLTFYVFDPGTNKYSSYQVFGIPFGNVQ
ncbi:MAG: hypothetical protein AAF357_12280, partial [Verrucomicrobiota bacterium]